MAKSTSTYVCQACGAVATRWAGRCDACGSWNTIVEEAGSPPLPGGGRRHSSKTSQLEFVQLDGPEEATLRRATGIAEFDRVCGGGLVVGASILIGGDPGIGKSTLLLQALASLAKQEQTSLPDSVQSNPGGCLYVSGEEAIDQIRLRARRLGLNKSGVRLAAATSVRDILSSLQKEPHAQVVVIDSVQTLYLDSLDSAPGTVAQVRASTQALIRLSKQRGFSLLLVGHVTKEGLLAGPKVLEHMVDTVLTFEGERGHQFRVLRAVKNRFGPTDEIGVFEMSDSGLREVENPSALFLAERRGEVSGSAVFAGMEGTRPILVEVQALVSPSLLGTPRRAVVGWDNARLAMVLAVLEARCGLVLAGKDVYLNVAGGLRISEPAADLAVAAALVSASSNLPVPASAVVVGEIGLAGEVRAVSRLSLRLKEAAKLGFTMAFVPTSKATAMGRETSIKILEITHLQDLLVRLSAEPAEPTRAGTALARRTREITMSESVDG